MLIKPFQPSLGRSLRAFPNLFIYHFFNLNLTLPMTKVYWSSRSVRQGFAKKGLMQMFSLAVAMLMSLGVYAQDRTVSGTVTDAGDGSGLPGVSIQVKGTNKGTQTGTDGSYKIAVPSNATLVFSFVGYVSQEIAAGSRTMIDVKLAADVKGLEEVVVVGYGTQKRKEISGTVTSVGSKEFNGGVLNNPLQAIQGKVAGLVISRPGGDPNSRPTVRLRGVGSLTAGSEPLYVVDGVPGVPIENIAPEDIESMDVLRDASSAAIYGARAANGVIIITTKRGKAGRTTVDYNGYYGQEMIARRPDIMTASEYRAAAQQLGYRLDDRGANTDWVGELTRTGASQNHNLGIGGGTENFSYRASLTYFKQEGIVRKSDLERTSVRINADQKALDGKLNIGVNLSIINSKRNEVPGEVFVFAQTILPTDPVRNADGSFFERQGSFSIFNPVAHLEGNTRTGTQWELLGNVNARYAITPEFSVGVNASTRGLIDNYAGYQSSVPKQDQAQRGIAFRQLNPGRLNTSTGRFDAPPYNDQLLELTANYKKKVGDIDLTLLGGYSYQTVGFEGFGARNNNFLTDDFTYNNLGAGNGLLLGNVNGAVYSYKYEYKLISFFGRAQASYKDLVHGTFALRRDGSTKFGNNNKWGIFPSASVAVVLSNMDFMKGSKLFDELKLRLAYGQTGNSEGIRPYASLSLVGAIGTYFDGPSASFLPSYGPVQNPNPDLKWEVNENIGVGIDFAILKQRLRGNIDFYSRNTRDLLYTVAAPQERGYVFGSILANVGSMKNQGVELALNGLVVDKKDFQWTVTLAGAYNKNEVVALNQGPNGLAAPDFIPVFANLGPILRGTSNVAFSVLRPGFSVGEFWGARVSKIDDEGKYVFKDLNGDAVIRGESDDRESLGSPQPNWTYAITNTFRYKNFDLTFLLNGRAGNKIFNTNRLIMGRQIGRLPDENAFRESVTSPIKDDRTLPSDYHVEDGSFLRLDNFTLGYNIPVENKLLKRARLYLSGRNLFLISGYRGVDPELNLSSLTPGIDIREFYYSTRSFNVGVNLSF
jgi:TonB-dependent starch-binding outer membrane protein SusC